MYFSLLLTSYFISKTLCVCLCACLCVCGLCKDQRYLSVSDVLYLYFAISLHDHLSVLKQLFAEQEHLIFL